MAGFVYVDKQNDVIVEFGVSIDSMYPPSMNINVIPKSNGSLDRSNALWVRLPAHDFVKFYQNITSPQTYGIIDVRSAKDNSVVGNIGFQNGQFVLTTGSNSYMANMDNDTIQALAQYVGNWSMNSGVYKDICENLRLMLCKSINTMVEDFLAQRGMPALSQALKMYPPTDNNGKYKKNNKFNKAQQSQMPQMPSIGGNGQYRAAPMNNNPGMPIPQMPSMNNAPQPPMNNAGSMNIPTPPAPQMNNIPTPPAPQMNNIPTPPAPQMNNIPTPPMPPMNNNPQPPINNNVGMNMGAPIPQSPNAAQNADIKNMLNTFKQFNQMPPIPNLPNQN